MLPEWLAVNILPTGKDRTQNWSRLNYTGTTHSRKRVWILTGPKAVKLLLPSCFFHCSSCLPLSQNDTTLHSITWMNTSGSCLREQKIISFLTASMSLDSSPVLCFLRQVGKVSMFILAVRSLDVLGKGNPKAHWNTFAVFFFFSTLYSGLYTKFSCPHLLQL